ncbi:extracellular solute-binding protein [Alteromonas sp. ASW11-36]|uniref:Extracellular solute-binding protein n=1 Tax=Alteromonas arenosi TaxID=3055817 RepID=A0ABT7SUV0_9ALTE|nr:extracellular solute-binding protein [Alteromonas sp. ASW11-36]MDM7859962.1 extracellular solute-binding protein [Alteromonas sp. ASW11-36]
MKSPLKIVIAFIVLVGIVGWFLIGQPSETESSELNVYSARKEALIKPLLDKFSAATGVTVNLVTGSADALITRMQTEGQFSPADILITTDAGRLVRAKTADLTQPIQVENLAQLLPDYLRDEQQHWAALTMRARPVMYAPDRVDPSQITSMLDLTKPEWQGRICIRSSSNIYNQSMIAALTLELGEEQVEEWAKGIVANMARPPVGGDRDQIKGVAAGECDIAVANTYYLAGMLASDDPEQRQQAQAVDVLWTDQNSFGTHVNISGIAVAKYAPNAEAANQLIAFMLEAESQQWYAQENHEYPVLEGVEWSPLMQDMGQFKALSVDLDKVGAGNAAALQLMDRAGWQ